MFISPKTVTPPKANATRKGKNVEAAEDEANIFVRALNRDPVPPFKPMSNDDQRTTGAFTVALSYLFGPLVAAFAFWALRVRGDLLRTHTAAALNFQMTLGFFYLGAVLWLSALSLPYLGVWVTLAALTIHIGSGYRRVGRVYRGLPATRGLGIKLFR